MRVGMLARKTVGATIDGGRTRWEQLLTEDVLRASTHSVEGGPVRAATFV